MDFTPFRSLLGGALIGVAASMLYFGSGRVAGVSGILGGLFTSAPGTRAWRVWFLGGLVAGGLVLLALWPAVFGTIGASAATTRPLALLGVAGLLVGFGARWGGGCTSGHGVCGISRLSARSLVATITFIAAGVATVLVTRLLGMGS